MKKFSLLFLLVAFIATFTPMTAQAQQTSAQEGLITWQNNGDFNALLLGDVDSITYSRVGLDGISYYSKPVVQEIWTPDSVYRIPINTIDSVVFKAPETIMKDNVFHITTWHYPYVTDATDLTVTFDTSIPADSLPTIGQVVVSDTAFVQYFEKGFAGRVVQIDTLDSGVRIVCEEISFEDIYDQLFSFGKSVGYCQSGSPSRAPRRLKIDEEGVTTFNLNDYWPVEPFKIIDDESGHVNLNIEPSISLNYALCYNVKGKENRFKCVLSKILDCNFDVNWKKDTTVHFEPKDPFVTVNIPTKIPLLFAQFYISGFVDLGGSIELNANFPFRLQSNIGFDSQEGFVRNFKGTGISTPQGSVELSASVYTGLSLGFKSFFINERLDWAEANVELKAGPKFTGTIKFDSDTIDGLDLYDNFIDSKVTIEPLVAQLSASVNTIFLDEPKSWNSGQWSVFGKKDYYLFPKFTTAPHFAGSTSTALTTEITRNLIFKVTPGIGLYQNNQLKYSYFSDSTYKWQDKWDTSFLQMDLHEYATGTYTAKPIFKRFGKTVIASPTSSVTIPQGLTVQDTINVKKATTRTIPFTGGWGNYSISIGDTKVCTAYVTGMNIKITGIKKGNTTLLLTDVRSNEKKTINVIVYETQEPPTIKVTPDEHNFAPVILGNSDSKTFTVTCTNVTGGVSISRSDNTGMFSVNNNTDATGNGTFTVTYNPNATGIHTMTLYIKCAFGPIDTVKVTGKCVKPTITVNPTSLNFGTILLGDSLSKTFTVTGTDLVGNLTLRSTNSTRFKLDGDKSSITLIPNANGAISKTVTVTYKPTQVQSNGGYIVITGTGLINDTVNLSGKCVVPTITVNPPSLKFESVVNKTSLPQTITVTCTDMPSSPTVTLSQDIQGVFKITSNTLTKQGGTLEVTFTPGAARSYSGQIIISGGGVTKTVNLTGTGKGSISVSPTSLNFETVVNSPVEKKFYVSGTNLTSALSVSSSNSKFTLSTTSISRAQASEGVEVTVMYNRSTAGSDTGTITVSGGGADSKEVKLTGSAVKPTITVNPPSLKFESVVNKTSVPQTITVTCTDMQSSPTVTLSQDIQGIFKITSNTLTKQGGTLEVTFTPGAARSYSGQIIISGGGVTKTVNLTGTGKGSISVSPTSLNFETVVNSPVEKKFYVSGTNLTGALSVSSSNSKFTLSTTSISRAQASEGVEVIVMYNRSTAGSDTGTITVSGGGADSKEVKLTGSAVKPTITVSTASLKFESVVNTTSVPQTITVTCTDMPSTPTVTLSQDIQGIFKITSNTLTKQGGTLKVTFTPETVRSYSGQIIISGGGVTKTVNLTGTGKGSPSITVNPESIWCGSIPYGSQNTKTITVTGVNLNGPLMVSSSDKTVFSVSPTTITPSNGSVSTTVTVTYKPSRIHVGNQQDSGTITISQDGVISKSVSVSGRGINASNE